MKQKLSFQDASKGLLDRLMKTGLFPKKSISDSKLLEIIKYRVSQISRCTYCLDVHHKNVIHPGETELRIHSLIAWEDCSYYSEMERVALAYAEGSTNLNNNGTEGNLLAAGLK